ncbi:hypothetical protein [Roseibium aggregatum]|jgi:hypothetical protein|uniref:Uncharacterized protein n=1 Tax=Roseibium aggregatum TaxID=187304 RepID=A0A0M6YB97_9HYPH|nr:hypothetical protein [Roseibium aggregatum]CTQ47342.1 hypothetical protein LAL4801_05804 [Roseibium aggregatum]
MFEDTRPYPTALMIPARLAVLALVAVGVLFPLGFLDPATKSAFMDPSNGFIVLNEKRFAALILGQFAVSLIISLVSPRLVRGLIDIIAIVTLVGCVLYLPEVQSSLYWGLSVALSEPDLFGSTAVVLDVGGYLLVGALIVQVGLVLADQFGWKSIVGYFKRIPNDEHLRSVSLRLTFFAGSLALLCVPVGYSRCILPTPRYCLPLPPVGFRFNIQYPGRYLLTDSHGNMDVFGNGWQFDGIWAYLIPLLFGTAYLLSFDKNSKLYLKIIDIISVGWTAFIFALIGGIVLYGKADGAIGNLLFYNDPIFGFAFLGVSGALYSMMYKMNYFFGTGTYVVGAFAALFFVFLVYEYKVKATRKTITHLALAILAVCAVFLPTQVIYGTTTTELGFWSNWFYQSLYLTPLLFVAIPLMSCVASFVAADKSITNTLDLATASVMVFAAAVVAYQYLDYQAFLIAPLREMALASVYASFEFSLGFYAFIGAITLSVWNAFGPARSLLAAVTDKPALT